ncbi:MAG: universal stress protein [Microthrixaceae bacterium]
MAGPILVGVDSSETARAAAAVAAQLAKALGRTLRVVTAYDRDEVEELRVGSDVFRVSSEEEAQRTASQVASEVASDLAVETGALVGKPADAIVAEAERVEASLIVVGNRRMQGVSRVLGSIANSVSHHAPCDVYIVKTT